MSKLLEARDILLDRGITQSGDLEENLTGCVCALGALNIAYNGEDANEFDEDSDLFDIAYVPADVEHRADIYKLATVARRRMPEWYQSVPYVTVYRYNDRGNTTLTDVVSLFEEAANL